MGNQNTLTVKILAFIGISAFLLMGMTFKNSTPSPAGVFTCMVNNKPFLMENMKAVMRNTTGGRIQISLSNDRFVKFFFINPEVKDFDLSTTASHEAIIRYSEPGTGLIYVPKSGHIRIKQLDAGEKVFSGEFEMELYLPGKDKVIKVTKGEFNVPFVQVR